MEFELDAKVYAVVFGYDANTPALFAVDDSTHGNGFDYIELMHQFDGLKRCAFVNPDDTQEQFFAVCSQDCMDPPMNIVRADSLDEAIDIAVDAKKGLQVDADQYGGDAEFEAAIEDGTVGIADGGNYYDAESIHIQEIQLQRVIVDTPIDKRKQIATNA